MEKVCLINGKTESGKTRGVLFDKVLEKIEKNENILFLDSKMEYYNNFSKKLSDNDYELFVLNLSDPIHSNGFNPYSLPLSYYKSGDKDKAYDLLKKIGNVIFADENPSIDPFWSNMSCNLFIGLSLIMFEYAPSDKVNLGTLNSCLNMVMDGSLNDFVKKLDSSNQIYLSVSGTLFAPSDTKGSILSVFKQKIFTYCNRENLLNLLCTHDFNFEDLGKKKMAIFVIFSGYEYKYSNGIVNVFLEQIFNYCFNKNIKFNFVLDNIDILPRINDLKNIIDMRSDNFNIYIATRNADILMERYGEKYLFDNVLDKIDTSDGVEISDYSGDALDLPVNKNKCEYFDMNEILDK